jgi:hypothetical protein
MTAGVLEIRVAMVDQGEHRLRDLSAPVFQVGEDVFGPLRSLDWLLASLCHDRPSRNVAAAAIRQVGDIVTLVGRFKLTRTTGAASRSNGSSL